MDSLMSETRAEVNDISSTSGMGGMGDIGDPSQPARVFAHPEALIAAVGEALGASAWLPIDQSRIDLFADATLDHQWITPATSTGLLTNAVVLYGNAPLMAATKYRVHLVGTGTAGSIDVNISFTTK